jgi:hypothetical protein
LTSNSPRPSKHWIAFKSYVMRIVKAIMRMLLVFRYDDISFLLSMNEVNINFFIDFLDELGLFIGEIPIFTRKKIPPLCFLPWFHGCPNENFVRPIFKRCFQFRDRVKDFSFWITEGIGLTGVSFDFWPLKQIPSGSSYTNFCLLFHFHVKYWPILMLRLDLM